MKSKLLTLCTTSLLTSLTVSAQWVLMEDFESGDLSKWTINENNCDEPQDAPINCSVNEIVIDPIDESSNVGLFRAGPIDVPNSRGSRILPFPEQITPEYTGKFTVYYKFALEDFRQDGIFGTTIEDNTKVTAGNESYGNMVVATRINTAGGGILEAHNNGYTAITQTPLENFTWYEIWIVHTNDSDLVNNPEEALTYDIYIKGGQFVDQTQIVDNGFYRDVTGVVSSFHVLQDAGGPGNPSGNSAAFIDDVYFAKAEMLDTPDGNTGGSDWLGYAVVDGWADTGDWLGWAYVEASPYILVDPIGWMYVSLESHSESGAWIYIAK